MGKGEIARYEQFLLFPHCFQKVCFPGASKGVILWEWVKQEGHDGPVSLHWLISKIPSYQTLQDLGNGIKHETPNKD